VDGHNGTVRLVIANGHIDTVGYDALDQQPDLLACSVHVVDGHLDTVGSGC
jgi:hypothetical protein